MQNEESYIHPSAIVEDGAVLGKGVKVWHFSHVMRGCVIGDFCSLGQNVFIAEGVQIGSRCRVQNNVSLFTGVICEDDVFLGPSCVFTNVINPRAFINRKEEFKNTKIEKGVTIGANATIVCGVTIGAYALIGAGAVVTKNIPAYALFVGNPSCQKGWVSKVGKRLIFDKKGEAFCPETGEKYNLKDGKVFLVK